MAKINLGKVVGEDGRGIVSIEKTSTVGLVDTYTITYTDGTTSTYNVTNGSGGGIDSVIHNETMVGAGTNASPLGVDTTRIALKSEIPDISGKQDTLVSGTNIKTINNTSILGSGNIDISGGTGGNIWMGNSNEYIIALNNGTITSQTICLITDGEEEPTVIQDGNLLYIYNGVTINQNESELEVL